MGLAGEGECDAIIFEISTTPAAAAHGNFLSTPTRLLVYLLFDFIACEMERASAQSAGLEGLRP